MGIPYSKQINAAFDQVTPLVASGYELLETVKNIALFITAIQIGIIALLLLNFIALLGVLFCLNPDLDKERRKIVTPAMKWIAKAMTAAAESIWLLFAIGMSVFAVLAIGYMVYVYHARQAAEAMAEDFVEQDEGLKEKEEENKQVEDGDEAKEEKS